MANDRSYTTGLATGLVYPARPNRLGEEIGWLDLTRTCRYGHTEHMTIDERNVAIPPAGYCLTCWPVRGTRSAAPAWRINNAR